MKYFAKPLMILVGVTSFMQLYANEQTIMPNGSYIIDQSEVISTGVPNGYSCFGPNKGTQQENIAHVSTSPQVVSGSVNVTFPSDFVSDFILANQSMCMPDFSGWTVNNCTYDSITKTFSANVDISNEINLSGTNYNYTCKGILKLKATDQ